ncbi:MAG: bifunctional precorrin-2 dehydrogenase/sirohydrochlorin ferrochelatase [Desulfatiglans sp.]|jgi:precorrin-2 dehydrogenase/sirohydrochlorin ferrochelatase|nr:bifunctional precorrin-2 dehydrogenase/sirohydrochlorin ferrochelatase [Thermodesulfobacteriota bacterium]MEE4352001.1 bifunctional precorrin-2 dehydrogenase/sirohydrochlorin ferrochelatase [Desulfatiglans sp.]
MSYYPVFLKLEGRTALIVGGGHIARRKAETLLRYGASVLIVSRTVVPELKKLIEDGTITCLGEEFEQKHLEGVSLVIAATDDKPLNHRVSQWAQKRGILVNAVDQPEDCSFIVPSVVKRGDLSIAISTAGKSPALAKKIRERLEGQFGEEYSFFLTLMGYLRREILSRGYPQEENQAIFSKIVDSDALEALAQRDWEAMEAILKPLLPEDLSPTSILDLIRRVEGE